MWQTLRHQSSPKREVSNGRTFQSATLLLELPRIHRARNRVQGHIEEHRSPASGQCLAARLRAFPVAMAGFIKVHVVVDDAREHMQTLGCYLLMPCPKFAS